MTKTMAEVLDDHELAIDYAEYFACTCGTIQQTVNETYSVHVAKQLEAAGFGLVADASTRPVPNAHDTTHIVRVVCYLCDHHGYQKVKLGEEIAHECSTLGMGGPTVATTICAWEYGVTP